MSLCPVASVKMAVALADLRLLVKRPILGGEVPVVVSTWLNGRLNLGVSSVSDGALGERVEGGEMFLVEFERKKDETLFVGESGG